VASAKANLEMPKIEEMLVSRFKDLTMTQNEDGENPLVAALRFGSMNN
jgi:hypothetical protein